MEYLVLFIVIHVLFKKQTINTVFFQACQDNPGRADKTGSFFVGTKSFRKQNLKAHCDSAKHLDCLAARNRPRINQGPLPEQINRMEETLKDQMKILFNTAYHVVKMELPFSCFPSLLQLQKKNGLEIGEAYLTAKACNR